MKIQRTKNPKLFFSKKEHDQIEEAILIAETKTSAEIRVHLDSTPIENDIFDRAKDVFEKIGMTQTKEKNGTLIFLDTLNHRFTILGDDGINSKVNQDFWKHIVETMIPFFKNDDFATGIKAGIKIIGEKLAQYFPPQASDKNELSNSVSI